MTVMHGVVPGVSDPVIYIGVVEKGWAMLELSVIGDQKHSSTPPRHSAPGARLMQINWKCNRKAVTELKINKFI